MTKVFQQSTTSNIVENGFTFGVYLWSNAANWAGGLPVNGGAATVNVTGGGNPSGYDDIANLSLDSLTLTSGFVAVAGSLSVGTVSFGTSTAQIYSDDLLGSSSASLTIGGFSGSQGRVAAVGPGAMTTVLSDAGEIYQADDGGELVLASAPAAPVGQSGFYYQNSGGGSTFAFEAPGGTISAPLASVAIGDSIALPGSSVLSVTFGANSLSIVTDRGATTFTNVSYSGPMPTGYTVSADPVSGLERVTFAQPDDDSGEQAKLLLSVDNNSSAPVNAAAAANVAFTIAGLDAEDTGTVTFTDGNNKTVVVAVNGTQSGYSANLTSLADGTITSSLAVNTDPYNNSFTPVSGNSVMLDQTPPTVRISLDHRILDLAAETALVTFAFSEAVTGFGASSIAANGGTLGPLQTSDGGKTYTASFTARAGLDTTDAGLGVLAGTYQDLAGNPGAGGSTEFVVDTVTPSVSVSASSSGVTLAQDTATITFAFSEAPTDFSLADTSAVGGTLSSLTRLNATTYSALFTGALNTLTGDGSVSVAAGSWHENNGNPGTGGSVGLTVDTMDHWVGGSGNWAQAANWGDGTPGPGTAVALAGNGALTLTISGPAIAYSLLINDPGATVLDQRHGMLTLEGPADPNGALTITAGTFVLAGGGLNAGPISIGSGGTLSITRSYTGSAAIGESIVNDGTVGIGEDCAVTFAGAIGGSGKFTLADGSRALFAGPVGGTGSIVLSGESDVEFASAASANIAFAHDAEATVKFDRAVTAPFTGTLAGLTRDDSLDLADLSFTRRREMAASYSGTAAGGVLTLSNGQESIKLDLVGDYTHAGWLLSRDGTGGTELVERPSGHVEGGDLSLLRNFLAGFGAPSGAGHLADGSFDASYQHPLLAQPHHG